jgi:hypothetical protein
MLKVNVSVKSVAEILNCGNLRIPDYQRPYKWERRHIRNLFYDLREAVKNVAEYRLGSIILHDNDVNLDIVDGQQRLISISLFLYSFSKSTLPKGARNLLNTEFIEMSRKHAKQNYEECVSLGSLIEKDELGNISDYMLNSCKVFVIIIPKSDLTKAFQLFDSQNNRGKALEPHDLLKAYHLRAIENPSGVVIEKWESYVNNKKLKLKDLFDKHLFRIRRWTNASTGLNKKKRGSELRFCERFIDDFKGVELESGNYPYLKLYRELKAKNIDFPSSLNMPIINGEAFFRFIEYSYSLFDKGVDEQHIDDTKGILASTKGKYAKNINLYKNLMISFIDRFGADWVDREVCEKVFVWAFFTRAIASHIYDSTIANYAGDGTFQKKSIYQKMFQLLATSATPREFVASMDTDLLNNFTAKTIIEKLEVTGKC